MQKNEDNNDIIKEENSNNNKDSSLVQWLTEYQGFLTLLLILVTAYFGYKNLELQENNLQLQKSIYSPRMVPTEYNTPEEIDNEYLASYTVSNLGYISGTYKVIVKSQSFYITKKNKVKEREIKWSYYIRKDDSSTQEFIINTPTSNLPLHANYTITLFDDEENQIRNYKFCYQHVKASQYRKVECN